MFPSLWDLNKLSSPNFHFDMTQQLIADYRIPFERALTLANQEKITEKLYPLFVHNIGMLLYHPSNAARPLPMAPHLMQPGQQEQPLKPDEEDDRRPRL